MDSSDFAVTKIQMKTIGVSYYTIDSLDPSGYLKPNEVPRCILLKNGFIRRRGYLNPNEVPQCILLHEINRCILLDDGF